MVCVLCCGVVYLLLSQGVAFGFCEVVIMMLEPVRVWSRDELLSSGLVGWQRNRYFIGRDAVSGYALIDGNIMEDVYDHLNRPGERYDKVFEYSL